MHIITRATNFGVNYAHFKHFCEILCNNSLVNYQTPKTFIKFSEEIEIRKFVGARFQDRYFFHQTVMHIYLCATGIPCARYVIAYYHHI